MSKREGPSVRVEASCLDCTFCQSERYQVQSDSCNDVYCTNIQPRRRVGDTSWETPSWCPLLAAAIRAMPEFNASPSHLRETTDG